MNDLLELVLNRGNDMAGTDSSWYARKKGECHPKAAHKTQQPISDEKILLAKYFRGLGHTWQWIADQVGVHESTIRRRCGK